MTTPWQTHDVIDLEYFLGGSSRAGAKDPLDSEAADNRRLYLDFISRQPEKPGRRAALKHWLDSRRRAETAGHQQRMLPGEIYRETVRIGGWIGFFAAFLAGAVLAGSLLAYGGTTPVNVFTFLWVLLAPQILLLAMLAGASLISRIRPAWHRKGIYFLIGALLRRVALRMTGLVFSRLPRSRQDGFQSALAMAGRARTVYGGIFFWPVFNTAQLMGIGFNLGVLSAMLVRIVLTDVAFGWQSTLQPDPRTVFGIVEFLAAPWAWILDPPAAHPTAAQVAGSKMVLKDGIYHLATTDLASWWPFLCLSVMFYGLLPRMVLLGFGRWRQARQLAALRFTHAACDRLWLQMTAPRVETPDRAEYQDIFHASGQPANETKRIEAAYGHGGSQEAAVLVMPGEAGMDAAVIGQQVRARFGLEPAGVLSATGDFEADAQNLARAMNDPGPRPTHVVMIIEAWQPPIRENLAWIKELKAAAGPSAAMILCLTGKPAQTGARPGAPTETQQAIWQGAVNRLADPYIRVEVLGE